jgi:germacradienol/geosmin synthase
MREFERVVSTELPEMFDQLNLDSDTRATLTGYAQELKHWLAGILIWHQQCHRYEEAELRRPVGGWTSPPTRPTGLGTSAARIPALSGGCNFMPEKSPSKRK